MFGATRFLCLALALVLVAAYPAVGLLEEDGRIEGVEVPSDLPAPERWRFVPRERMPPGSFLTRLFVTSLIFPVFSFESDVGAGGGVGVYDLDFRHQGRIELLGAVAEYTAEGQQTYEARWERLLHYRRVPAGVFHEERNRIFFTARYRKTLTRRFFGRGDGTTSAGESSYTDESPHLELGWVRTLPGPAGNYLAGARVRYQRHRLSDGFVSDAANMRVLYPEEFAGSPRAGALHLVLDLTYDTRDSFANPYSGLQLTARAELQPLRTGRMRTNRFALRGSVAFTVPPLTHRGGTKTEWSPPRDVLAIGAGLQWIAGDDPLYYLPALGGTETLRGYIAGRWHDRSAAHASIEYRPVLLARGFPVGLVQGLRVERLGGVVFLDAGAVADEVEDLEDASWKLTPGVGLRFQFERDAVLRLDVGFSSERTNWTVNFGQAF